MKERIAEETSELREHNRDLKVQLRTLFQKNRCPPGVGLHFIMPCITPEDLRRP